VNKHFLLFLILIYSCSFNSNSSFWSKTKKTQIDKNLTKTLFKNIEPNKNEFNPNLKIKLPIIKTNILNYNLNNDGFTSDIISNDNFSKFKFSKIENFSDYEPNILVSENNLFFFDNNGTIIKFNKKSEIIWKKNYYSKTEKKNNPILFIALDARNLFIADTNANYYSLNIKNGNLKWKKKHTSSFNSQIKIKDGKALIVDMENNLKCISLKNGKILWSVPTEITIVSSQKKHSVVLIKDTILFTNSVGDLTAVDFETGDIIWQTPTQTLDFSKNITLRISDIVSDKKNVYLSNNKNEFISMNINTGITNWKQSINSELRPAVISDYIVTVSNEGLLIIINKNTGDIIRINDILKNIKKKKKKRLFSSRFCSS
tara:strand:+ start:368 stop:1486 length:1119 start_codon:yes stop_codon:yes gene_type:complete